MDNSKGPSNIRSLMYSGKHALLPPRIPFPSVTSSFVDYVPSGIAGSKAVQKVREGNTHHQRTSSETFLMEEQPSWLDDLLNEPETPPIRKGGHRRSSSDSFAYVDVANGSSLHYAPQEEYGYKNSMLAPSWAPHDFNYHKGVRKTSPFAEANTTNQKNRAWDMPLNAVARSSGVPLARETTAVSQNSGSSTVLQEADKVPTTSTEKRDSIESSPTELKNLSDKKDGSHAKIPASEADTKRAKQQFAQRSRVRKLQYIADLERNVQALQVEGSDVSAELEFLNQQNLILSMENNALKQRLESLAQEQLIKYMEHEVLEREIGRLRALYQQQQQPHQQQQQQPSLSHRRTRSKDLDSQFANLSLKHKDANSSHDAVTGPLQI